MQSLTEMILESNKPKDYLNRIEELKKMAVEKGLKVVFRDKTLGPGDFAIFIYDKQKQHSYLVGYDGYWPARRNETLSFDYCYNQAKEFIEGCGVK